MEEKKYSLECTKCGFTVELTEGEIEVSPNKTKKTYTFWNKKVGTAENGNPALFKEKHYISLKRENWKHFKCPECNKCDWLEKK